MIGAMWCDLPPRVTPAMRDPRFWIERAPAPDALLMSDEAKRTFNAAVYTQIGIPPVLSLPDALPAADVAEALRRYAAPEATHYDGLGRPLDDAYWQALMTAARPPLPEEVPVRFGLAVRRTAVRAFPTADVACSAPGQIALDRLQETTIDLGWPVAALVESADGAWWYCLTPHYWGWVAAADLAFGGRDAVAGYAEAAPWCTVTASRALIGRGRGGVALVQMGTRLPLVALSPKGYQVRLPVRAADGALSFEDGALEAGAAAAGDAPLTVLTAIAGAFRMLGEPYAWGGSRGSTFGRDCSRLVRDVYAAAGLYLPRNGNQQAVVCRRLLTFSPEDGEAARQQAIVESMPAGALFVLPGHIMLALGAVEGVPYVIHATLSPPYNGVIVSDLALGEHTPKGSLLSRLTAAVSIA